MGITPATLQNDDQLTSLFNYPPHLLFSHPRPHLGVGVPPPAHLPPNCDRVSQHRRTESLVCSESNHPRFYYFMSHYHLARKGQTKMLLLSKINVYQMTFKLRKVEKRDTIVFLASRCIET